MRAVLLALIFCAPAGALKVTLGATKDSEDGPRSSTTTFGASVAGAKALAAAADVKGLVADPKFPAAAYPATSFADAFADSKRATGQRQLPPLWETSKQANGEVPATLKKGTTEISWKWNTPDGRRLQGDVCPSQIDVTLRQGGSNPDLDGTADVQALDTIESGAVIMREVSPSSALSDTTLTLWDIAGTLLDSNDDDGPRQKPLIERELAPGCYVLGGSEFRAFGQSGFLLDGDAQSTDDPPGDFIVQVEDSLGDIITGNKVIQPDGINEVSVGEWAFFCFCAVPPPTPQPTSSFSPTVTFSPTNPLKEGYPTDALVAYYSFNDGTADMSFIGGPVNTAFNADNQGADPVEGAGPDCSGAMSFDGNAKILVPTDVTDFISDDKSRAICLWVKLDEFGSEPFFSFGERELQESFSLGSFRGPPQGDPTITLFLGSGQDPQLAVFVDANLQGPYSSSVGFPRTLAGNWNHYCATYDSYSNTGVFRVYINGELAGEAPNSTIGQNHPLETSAGPLALGSLEGTSFPKLEGDIDEVLVYAREISPGEVSAIYEAGLENINQCEGPTRQVKEGYPTNGLVAYYSFNDGTADLSFGDPEGPCCTGEADAFDGSNIDAIPVEDAGPDCSGAMEFDGETSKIVFPPAVTEFIANDNSRSICLWANIRDFRNLPFFSYGFRTFFQSFALGSLQGGDQTPSGAQINLFLGSGQDPQLEVFVDAGESLNTGFPDVLDGKWNHYCATYDSYINTGVFRVYINGDLAGEAPAGTIGPPTPLETPQDTPLLLGYLDGLPGNRELFFDGMLDEFLVYSRELSPDDVSAIYEAGSAGVGECAPSSKPSSKPSNLPSGRPSGQPSSKPSSEPSNLPSGRPTGQPSSKPSSEPSSQPSSQPSSHPTTMPSAARTPAPTPSPTPAPTAAPTSAQTAAPTACEVCADDRDCHGGYCDVGGGRRKLRFGYMRMGCCRR
jgi:hypothetical protein